MKIIPLVLGLGSGLGAINMTPIVYAHPSGGNYASAEPRITAFQWRNQSLVETIRDIDRRRSGMRLTPGEESENMLREARAGGMYGLDQD